MSPSIAAASRRGHGMKVGVLALQGASALHAEAVAALGAHPVEVRSAADLAGIDALILPGGESTTLSHLLSTSGLFEPLAGALANGLPTFGTCAGMILLAHEVLDGRPGQRTLDVVDVGVRRNAFGRQVDSFEAPLPVAGLLGGDFPATFIRAPVVERVGDGVEVLASVVGTDGVERAVACRQGPVLVTAFHPELSGDLRLHQAFLTSA